MLKVFDFEHTPIVDIVNEILVDASSRGASDIHFDPKDNIMQIRIRIDGGLVDYATVPEEYIKNLVTRIKIISGMNITESRLPQDGAIKGVVKDIELDLRVSSINTNKGEKIVVRILDYTLSLNGIENLGFSDYNYKKVIEMINEPNGIILVTGATGTGKTTTVYSMLQRLSNDSTNIMSIEDPVEMDIENVNQIQVNPDIGLTFATALRSILRQDPNIIMIGEIRDSETATIAIRASVTGHLVLSTLHTNDSLSTIERLMDMDVEKYLLAEALSGIISQRLARRLCPKCKKLRKTSNFEKDLIKRTLDMDVDEVYEAVGCNECNHGYKGRIAFQEVLKIDQKIQDALSMNVRKDKLRNLVYNDNVITLLQDGMIKVVRGDTTIEELLRLIDLDEENAESFKLDKEILNNELNKKVVAPTVELREINENNEEEMIEDEIIVPNTSDVVIDTIEDNDTEEEIEENVDINNMESLDNDENFIEKIDEAIEDEKESKKKKKANKKKEKKTENNDEETIEEPIEENSDTKEEEIKAIEEETIPTNTENMSDDDSSIISTNENIDNIQISTVENTDNVDENSISDEIETENETSSLEQNNMESLDNDESFIDKINGALKGKTKKKEKKKKENKKKKKEKKVEEEIRAIEEETTPTNTENMSDDDSSIISTNENIDNIQISTVENTDNVNKKSISDDNETENETISSDQDNNDLIDNTTSMESLDNDENFIEKIDEVLEEKPKKKEKKKKRKKKEKKEDNIEEIISSEETPINNEEQVIIVNDEIIDENNNIANTQADSNEITTDDVKPQEDDDNIDINVNSDEENNASDEISESEISELEKVIENIEISEESDNDISEETGNSDSNENTDNINKTIEISISDASDEVQVADIKTIKGKDKDDNEMSSLDYNIDFIDKIYDDIEKKRIIDSNDIDYEKIEKLGSLQNNIESRVSRMLNKKRYKKIKKSDK